MACAWTNKRNAVEVCSNGYIYPLGSYVYITFDDPGYSIINVAQDLSVYVATPTTAADFGLLYAKNRTLYNAFTDQSFTVPTVLTRHDGGGAFTAIPDVFTGAAENILTDGSTLRVIDMNLSDNFIRLRESNDGEVWDIYPGSAPIDGSPLNFPSAYTEFGSRLIVAPSGGSGQFHYSDTAGATWGSGSGYSYSGYGGASHKFVESGTNVIAIRDDIYVSADGAAWAKTALIPAFSTTGIAVSGTGMIVAIGDIPPIVAPHGIAYSWDHGASWTKVSLTALGFAGSPQALEIYWDGAQFVMALWDGPGQIYMYTSPTGATWTLAITIPDRETNIVQIID